MGFSCSVSLTAAIQATGLWFFPWQASFLLSMQASLDTQFRWTNAAHPEWLAAFLKVLGTQVQPLEKDRLGSRGRREYRQHQQPFCSGVADAVGHTFRCHQQGARLHLDLAVLQ